MATDKEIMGFYQSLIDAYPNYTAKDTGRSVVLFQKMLRRYDARALEYAAEQIIRKYKFFPAISEIIDLIDDLPPAPQPAHDQLRAMALELPLESDAWYRMAAAFEQAGRTCAAEAAYARAQALGAMPA